MKKVKSVKVTGAFDVSGIVNYNGIEKRNGNNNHKAAKRNSIGTDYTSSNCLTQAMFSEYVPRQPGSEEAKQNYPSFVGSVAGQLRGGMDTDSGSKRKSPITLLDAYTIGDERVHFEQGTSSKPKESDLKTKKGEEAGDVSIFSRDNAGPRQQELSASLRIADLQLNEIGEQGVVTEKNKDKFLSSLQDTLETLGAPTELNEGEFSYATAKIPSKRSGVLFSDEQQSAFVLEFLRLLEGIEIMRKSASLCVNKESLQVEIVSEDNSSITLPLDDAKEVLKTAQFQQFWK